MLVPGTTTVNVRNITGASLRPVLNWAIAACQPGLRRIMPMAVTAYTPDQIISIFRAAAVLGVPFQAMDLPATCVNLLPDTYLRLWHRASSTPPSTYVANSMRDAFARYLQGKSWEQLKSMWEIAHAIQLRASYVQIRNAIEGQITRRRAVDQTLRDMLIDAEWAVVHGANQAFAWTLFGHCAEGIWKQDKDREALETPAPVTISDLTRSELRRFFDGYESDPTKTKNFALADQDFPSLRSWLLV